jgi:hypothetical protein
MLAIEKSQKALDFSTFDFFQFRFLAASLSPHPSPPTPTIPLQPSFLQRTEPICSCHISGFWWMSTLKGGQLTRFHATWIRESMQLRHVEDGWMEGLGTEDKLLLPKWATIRGKCEIMENIVN